MIRTFQTREVGTFPLVFYIDLEDSQLGDFFTKYQREIDRAFLLSSVVVEKDTTRPGYMAKVTFTPGNGVVRLDVQENKGNP